MSPISIKTGVSRTNSIDGRASWNVLRPERQTTWRPLETPMGRAFMAMMSAMAEDERLRIIKRTHEGRQIARAKGVRMGRKPKLTPHQKTEARRIAKGETTRDLAKSYGVSVSRNAVRTRSRACIGAAALALNRILGLLLWQGIDVSAET